MNYIKRFICRVTELRKGYVLFYTLQSEIIKLAISQWDSIVNGKHNPVRVRTKVVFQDLIIYEPIQYSIADHLSTNNIISKCTRVCIQIVREGQRNLSRKSIQNHMDAFILENLK